MVRNWQARVEAAGSRRKEAKHRKQKSEEKRQFKQWVQEFTVVLDRNRDALHSFRQRQVEKTLQNNSVSAVTTNGSRSHITTSSSGDATGDSPYLWKLQLWTDAPPCHAFDDDDDDDDGQDDNRLNCFEAPLLGAERKNRSKSLGDGKGAATAALKEETADLNHNNNSNSGNKGKKGKGRGRSNSTTTDSTFVSATTTTNASSAKKKIHPRSSGANKDTLLDDAGGSNSDGTWMCRSFFFTGTCDQLASRSGGGSGRKAANSSSGACRYRHTSANHQTLHDVLSSHPKSKKAQMVPTTATITTTDHATTLGESQLKLAERAEIEATEAEAASLDRNFAMGAMDMVYYLETTLMDPCAIGDKSRNVDSGGSSAASSQTEKPVDGSSSTSNNTPTNLPLSDQMTHALSSVSLYLSSVVYIALNGELVFDRFRNGSIYSADRDFLAGVLGAEAVANRRDDAAAAAADVVTSIPGPVLAVFLTFLPDAAVAAAARVCRAWHTEITLHLPVVWKHLLDRHDWPYPSVAHAPDIGTHGNVNGHNAIECNSAELRKHFQEHYTVIRDMKALQKGLHAICDVRVDTVEKEMAYQDFSSRKHSPSHPNCCVGLQEWSPNRLLVAYHHDCSLRLFETVTKAGSRAGEKVCRELICQRIDPYKNTKKRNCRIVAMGLDEQCVASLCHVTGSTGTDAEAYILVVMSREDFLLGESSGAAESGCSDDVLESLKVIDVGESVLNYLISADDCDHKLLELVDFVSHGGDVGDVEVLASQVLATCGYGRFMIEVSISIPIDEDDGSATMHLIDRKLFLFSASIGAIVWAGESSPPTHDLNPRREDVSISFLRRAPGEGRSRAACYYAVASTGSPIIMVGDIEPSGEVQCVQVLESSLTCWKVMENDERWATPGTGLRPILVTSTDVIVADVWVRREDDVIQERKSVISFCPRWPSTLNVTSFTSVVVAGNIEVIRMACIRDSHVILICRQFTDPPLSTNEFDDERAVADIAGHWFGDDDNTVGDHEADRDGVPLQPPDNARDISIEVKVTAIVVHCSSRREIGRLCLLNGQEPDWLLPHLVLDNDETVGLGLSWHGVVMTGNDVRATRVEEEQYAKKKKKRSSNKGFKKDAFRTHNGDRCY